MEVVIPSFSSGYSPENTFKPYTTLAYDFPAELILMIFRHLNSYDLVQAGRACRRLHMLSLDATLDLAAFETFKRMGTKRICCKTGRSNGYSNGFSVHGNSLIYVDDEKRLIRYDFLTCETAILSPLRAQVQYLYDMDDYFYCTYMDDDCNTYLKITSIDKPLDKGAVFNLSNILGATYLFPKITCNQNILVLAVNDHVLCFKELELILHIKPLNRSGIETFVINQAFLLISYSDSYQFTQHLYHLDTLKLISHRTNTFCQKKIKTLMTSQLIINLKSKDGAIGFELLDFNFNQLNFFHLKLDSLYCDFYICSYEKKICILGSRTLLFYDFSTAKVIKKHNFSDLSSEQGRIHCYSKCADKLVIAKKRSLEVFDMHTGNMMKKFALYHTPAWVKFSKNNQGYYLNYEVYDEKTGKSYYQQIVPKTSVRKRKKH